MQKKKPTSLSKISNRKQSHIKKCCDLCQSSQGLVLITQKSLYSKYSSQHYSQLDVINNCIKEKPKQYKLPITNCISLYYKKAHRKIEFTRIKEVYKMYKDIPRLFMSGIKNIINKCHERKRLLEYFHIAKILGLRVENVQFSTFVLSLSSTRKPNNSYHKILGQISQYEFSENVEKEEKELTVALTKPETQTKVFPHLNNEGKFDDVNSSEETEETDETN